ncbi:DUF2486 family protein [Paraburkholderia nodosa]|uniref:DUF2486 family protein n=1 Tax=Paraburkholderia nodosa TaxID=392320 RepID=UPI00048303F0|nr:DUF2486 family protein [Paraburkholderia nodosa]
MSGMHESEDASIPLLSEVMVSGNPLRAHNVEEAKSATAAAVTAAVAEREEGLFAHDADALVERLRGRCLTWLTGEGRAVIEARCGAAMQEHTNWLVGQVSREIGLALETELTNWVKAAVREELAARAGRPPSA